MHAESAALKQRVSDSPYSEPQANTVPSTEQELILCDQKLIGNSHNSLKKQWPHTALPDAGEMAYESLLWMQVEMHRADLYSKTRTFDANSSSGVFWREKIDVV